MRSLLVLLFSTSIFAASDSATCAKCHAKIAEFYSHTGMGRSFYRPSAANTVEDYANRNQFLHSRSNTYYSMAVRDGAFYQRRWQIGFDGKETNVEEMTIDYVIGSGNHSRSYLHRMPSGGLIELPLSWYSEKGGYWAMSPGFDSTHPQTRRYASYECIFCHNAVPKIPALHDDPVFVGDLPEGIDCARCHGPGEKHLRVVQTAGSKLEDVRASIVNPARLNPTLSMDLCMQCHLEPTSSELPALIRRFNREPDSFRPGEPLRNFLLAFDHAPGAGHDDKFEIVGSSAYRLRQSQCFLKSNGVMSCLTCHDPHTTANDYTKSCLGCHASLLSSGKHQPAKECVSCHMPKRRTEDVVHVVMTDHLIQRRPPARDLLANLVERHSPEFADYRGEVVPYYPSDPDPLYKAVAQVAMRNNLEKGVLDLAREIAVAKPKESEFYMVLGDAQQAINKPREAIAAYQQALLRRPNFERGLLSLATAYKASGQIPRAAATLDQAIRIAPRSASAWFQSGTIAFAQGQTAAAIEKMQKAVTLDADLTGGRTGLAEILWRTGKIDRAEEELRAALRTDPYDAAAYNLLGRILAGKNQMAESLFDFEKATRLRPGYAPHLYDYALTLSAVNRLDDAQASVEAALQADPKMAEAHALLGQLFAAKRQLPESAREYSEALKLRPDFARAHLDLARVLAAQGNIPEAIQHLKSAATGSDPQVANVAKQALENLGQR